MDTNQTFVVKAVHAYKTRKKGELPFKKDQCITVTSTNEEEFMYYGHYGGKEGWFPYFYVKAVSLSVPKPPVRTPNSPSQPGSVSPRKNSVLKSDENIAESKSGWRNAASAIANQLVKNSVDSETKKKSAGKKERESAYVLKSGMVEKNLVQKVKINLLISAGLFCDLMQFQFFDLPWKKNLLGKSFSKISLRLVQQKLKITFSGLA